MWFTELPVFIPFFIGATLALITKGHLRSVLMLGIITVSGIHLVLLPADVAVNISFLGYELTPYRVDGLSRIFGYVFHIAAFVLCHFVVPPLLIH